VRSLRLIPSTLALALLTALAFPAFASAEISGDPAREIIVYGQNDQTLVTFKRLDCRVKGSGGGKKFKALGSSDGWKLDIRANDFTGFDADYGIEYGIKRTNFTIKPPGTQSYYSNFFFPGDEPPPYGGALAFNSSGKNLGIGFIAAFFSSGDDDAVGMVGHAKCRYPKKR
jgi:hypothetical protein